MIDFPPKPTSDSGIKIRFLSNRSSVLNILGIAKKTVSFPGRYFCDDP